MSGRERVRSFILTGKAYGAFNVFNAESIRGVVRAVVHAQTGAYIQTSASTVRSYGAKPLAAMVRALIGRDERDRFVLHLDHCLDSKVIGECVDAGWDSVMIDASGFSLDENIRRTRAVVAMAHEAGVAVEGEIGSVGDAEDGFENDPDEAASSVNAEDVERFVRETGIDLVAIGVGTKHGFYQPGACDVDVALLQAARRRCPGTPFVLHGGSGIPMDQVQAAIRAGVRKVNISTELKEAYLKACSAYIGGPNPYAVIEGVEAITESIYQVVRKKIEEFQRIS